MPEVLAAHHLYQPSLSYQSLCPQSPGGQHWAETPCPLSGVKQHVVPSPQLPPEPQHGQMCSLGAQHQELCARGPLALHPCWMLLGTGTVCGSQTHNRWVWGFELPLEAVPLGLQITPDDSKALAQHEMLCLS